MAMTNINLQNINYQYGDTVILKNIEHTFEAGRFYTILGPSGCGKTTILKMIGGFIHPTDGKVSFDGRTMNGIDANRRKVNTVFQDYALFPHLNVYENIAFGLKVRRISKNEIRTKVEEALRFVNLADFRDRPIDALSGGQRQRVAIARAIVNEPDVLLLDEPLSALDQNLRVDMQYELKEIQKRLGITFIFVTHDQEEALALSDEILVMNNGEIVQAGPPKDIYDEPLNRYVAEFIGDSNIVRGVMVEDNLVSIYGRNYSCVDGGLKPNTSVDVMIRPEDLLITGHDKGKMNVTIDSSLFRGVHYEIGCIDQDGYEWIVHSTKDAEIGQKAALDFERVNIHVMVPGEDEDAFKERLESYQEDEV
ncbi:ABC transporter ATP-binding protein [Salinicoccus sp. ID82-1]|nr:ABC transporter ATP-binding protein [Salinicoccus sp. ID82-1]